MKVLIIEDELPAANRLQSLIKKLRPSASVVEIIDSVSDSIDFLNSNPELDLIFMDIQLADGLSFEIFKHHTLECPVIFTTAYDHYALKAIKVNGLDYLLKPLEEEEFNLALNKFDSTEPRKSFDFLTVIEQLKQGNPEYRSRFLVKLGDQLKMVNVADIAYFYSEAGHVSLVSNTGKTLLIDFTLDQLENELNPSQFFRISRKSIVSIPAITQIHSYFNSRLKLELTPKMDEETIVSRERVQAFKAWLDT